MSKKYALVVGIANQDSISAHIARSLSAGGFTLLVTYLNEKALPYVREATEGMAIEELFPFQVGSDEDLGAIIDYCRSRAIRLDVLLHGIAFASEMKKELHQVSWQSFKESTRISAFSMVEISARLIAADLLGSGASILTLSYIGSHLAVQGYNMMGPVKSILEALVRGLASELGGLGIRVNALSPGPVMTRAASGIKGFGDLLDVARKASPLARTADPDDIGKIALEVITNPSINGAIYLVDCGASAMIHVDSGESH